MGSKTGARDGETGSAHARLMRLPAGGRRIRRGHEKRGRRDVAAAPQLAETPSLAPAADPVRIAVLTLEYLSHASMRASFTGREVKVAAPDAATAAIFRAALSQTVQTRATDRLIRVVVA